MAHRQTIAYFSTEAGIDPDMPTFGGGLGGGAEAFGVRVTEHVDRVRVAPMRRQDAIHGIRRFGGEACQRGSAASTVGDERIGGEHARAAGVGDDGEASAMRTTLARQDLDHAHARPRASAADLGPRRVDGVHDAPISATTRGGNSPSIGRRIGGLSPPAV
jgi:hypothetical protein